MIIKHKEFPNKRVYEIDYCGRPLRMEIGRMAELANAAVLTQYGETTVLVAVTASPRPRDGIDYFPLSVDFNESSTPWAASPAASCAARAVRACPPSWRAASSTARCARSSRATSGTTSLSSARSSASTATAPPR